MSKQMIIYERAVPITPEQHGGLSVDTKAGYGFAAGVNSVPLAAAEFAAAASEHVIVFVGSGDDLMPTVILGRREGDNAFVNGQGQWIGGYIPAFLRRYPFVFAAGQKEGSFTLCIDEAYEGLKTDGIGERLFDAEGNRTDYLERMLKFSTDYQAQFNRTRAFMKRLVDLDLLEDARAEFGGSNGASTRIAGFRTIGRDKLKALPGDTQHAMAQTDELELCYLHLHSLRNIATMDRRLRRD